MKKSSATFVAVLTLFSVTAFAQDGSRLDARERASVKGKEASVAYEARQTVEALFGRLCPGRCELVSVDVKMARPEPVGQVVPGFESAQAPNFAVDAEAVEVTVLLDSKLPTNFRRNIPRMIQYRLNELAPNIRVRPEALDFPEPQLEPMPPVLPEPPRARPEAVERLEETPEVPEEVEPEPAAEPAAEEAGLWQEIKPILAEIAPWIGPMLMMLLLFGMVLALLRRLNAQTKTEPAGSARSRRPEEVDPDELRAALIESRVVRNRVLRQWLEDDLEAVAQLIPVVGADVLDDLKSDAGLKGRLATVSEYVRDGHELTEDELRKLARQLRNRVAAARVTLDEEGMTRDWEFLEGLSVGGLRTILAPCTTAEKIHVVGLLREAMRGAFLETLDESARRELFLGTRSDGLDKKADTALASRLRKAAEDLTHSGREIDGQASLIVDMIVALSLEEQESMLREIKGERPDVAHAVLSRLALETTTLHASEEVLADIVHQLPIATLANFLRGTRADVRDRILAVTGQSQRSALTAELALDIPVGRAEFMDARTRFTSRLRDAMLRDGEDLARINARVVMRTNINPVESNEATS